MKKNIHSMTKAYLYSVMRLSLGVCVRLIHRLWNVSGSATSALLLLFWLYGGFVISTVLGVVVTGMVQPVLYLPFVFAYYLLVRCVRRGSRHIRSGIVAVTVLILVKLYSFPDSILYQPALSDPSILYNISDWLIYQPDMPRSSRIYVPAPSRVNHEQLFISSKDGVRLHSIFLKQQHSTSAPTVLFLHGNAANIGYRMDNAKGLYDGLGCNVFLLEYRGYGKSDGLPTEQGLYDDAEAAMDFLLSRPDIDTQKIFLFGRSLGGAVAVHLSTQAAYSRHIAAVILENTFTSIPGMAKFMFNVPGLDYMPLFVYKSKYLSDQKIPHMRQPTMFIVGMADKMIPTYMMQHLFTISGSSNKKLLKIQNGDHNDTWLADGYYEAMLQFINEVFKSMYNNKIGSLHR